MSDHQAKECTVIGAGIVGLCTALNLQDHGYSVRLVDRDPPAEGCSFGNAGILSAWSCVPLSVPGLWRSIPKWLVDREGPIAIRWSYLPRLTPWLLRFLRAGRADKIAPLADAMFALNHSTVELYRGLLAGTGHADLIRDSNYLHLYRQPDAIDLDSLPWRLRRERGAPVDILSADEIREIEPDVSPRYVKAVRIGAQGHTVNPGRLGKVLAERVLSRGGEFHHAEVLRLRSSDNASTVIETTAGPMHAKTLVITAGAWSHRLASDLGCRIPLETERGYHMTFANPCVQLNSILLDVERQFALTSMETGLRCAGTVELGGVEAPPNYRRSQLLEGLGKRVLPNLNTQEGSEWMGHRPSLPDTVPVIGAVPGHPTVYLAFGHGHLGLTGAPMTGRIIAALITGNRLNIDLEPYRAGRFA